MDREIQRMVRHARRREHFPPGAVCTSCGEADVRALIQGKQPLRCYQCDGRSTEDHHLAGRRNARFIVTIPANDHRILSDMQYDWELSMLKNPHKSPLVTIAATIEGWRNILLVVVERAIGWIPPALLALDLALTEKLGEQWWMQDCFAAFLLTAKGA